MSSLDITTTLSPSSTWVKRFYAWVEERFPLVQGILIAVMMATFMLMQVPRSAVCAERISEVLATETFVRRSPDPRPLGAVQSPSQRSTR